jgi:hypothetical protein
MCAELCLDAPASAPVIPLLHSLGCRSWFLHLLCHCRKIFPFCVFSFTLNPSYELVNMLVIPIFQNSFNFILSLPSLHLPPLLHSQRFQRHCKFFCILSNSCFYNPPQSDSQHHCPIKVFWICRLAVTSRI